MLPLIPIVLFPSLRATENKVNFLSTHYPSTHLKCWSPHLFCCFILFQLNTPDCAVFSETSMTVIKDTTTFKNKWLLNYLPFGFKQCGTKHIGSSIKFCHIQTPYEFLILNHVFLRLQYMVKLGWNLISPRINHLKAFCIYKLLSFLGLKKNFFKQLQYN